MVIEFILPWGLKKGPWKKAFKHASVGEMVEEYRERLSHFTGLEILVFEDPVAAVDRVVDKKGAEVRWLCDLPKNRRAKLPSSEDLARQLQDLMNRGVAVLRIFIGPPDGWKEEDLELINPQMVWSFGPLTLTHEMAALIAVEQVYRGFTILKGLPYHSGH